MPGATILRMTEHVFSAEIWEHSPDEPGSWHFCTLPVDVADDVSIEAGPRGGFGSVRVEVSIGSSTWRTSLFPDSDWSIFPLNNPGIVSIPLGFLLGFLGTISSREPAAEDRFTELEVRALTGAGAEGAVHH